MKMLLFLETLPNCLESVIFGTSQNKPVLADHSHLNLNLKDDLYLYTRNKENIKIWEMYQIHPTIPTKVLPYGNWSDRGIELKKESKWQRRKDLTVNL